MNRLPLWLTIIVAAVAALVLGLSLAIPQDYSLIKEDRPYSDADSDLGRHMTQEGFKVPIDMQKIIDELDLAGWKGSAYEVCGGKGKYLVVEYANRQLAEKIWGGEFGVIEILCTLVFSYEDKRCVAAQWFDKEGKEHRIKYDGKHA